MDRLGVLCARPLQCRFDVGQMDAMVHDLQSAWGEDALGKKYQKYEFGHDIHMNPSGTDFLTTLMRSEAWPLQPQRGSEICKLLPQ